LKYGIIGNLKKMDDDISIDDEIEEYEASEYDLVKFTQDDPKKISKHKAYNAERWVYIGGS
jgi:hypothetical protein